MKKHIDELVLGQKRNLELFGTTKNDLNHNRVVKEILGEQVFVDLSRYDLDYSLNPKYEPELKDIKDWYDSNFPGLSVEEKRRQVVYFNNNDYENRLQCISLFQIIDDTMTVYQRSGDTIKMKDDIRFFKEIIDQYFPDVDGILITYGSFHTQISK